MGRNTNKAKNTGALTARLLSFPAPQPDNASPADPTPYVFGCFRQKAGVVRPPALSLSRQTGRCLVVDRAPFIHHLSRNEATK